MRYFCSFMLILCLPAFVFAVNLLNGPDDVVFDLKSNRTLVGNWAGNNIIQIDSQGNQTFFKSGIWYCHGLEIEGDTLYAASYRSLLLLQLSTGSSITSISVPGSEYLGHIALDHAGNAYLSDWSAKKIFKVDVQSGTAFLLAQLNRIPVGLWCEPEKQRIVVLTFGAASSVMAVDTETGAVSTIRNTQLNDLDALIHLPDGNYYCTSLSGNALYRFSGDWGSEPVLVSTGFSGPSGLGYNPEKGILGITNYENSTLSTISIGNTSVPIRERISAWDLTCSPNPANPTTVITFSVTRAQRLKLSVIDLVGRELDVLVSSFLEAGTHQKVYNASHLASGIYFVRLVGDGFSVSRRFILIK